MRCTHRACRTRPARVLLILGIGLQITIDVGPRHTTSHSERTD
ncbi:MAG TPA: hypothetical protein VGL46_15190 [Pseudonocardiaceae bacterium]